MSRREPLETPETQKNEENKDETNPSTIIIPTSVWFNRDLVALFMAIPAPGGGWIEGTPERISTQLKLYKELELKLKDKSNPYNQDLIITDEETTNGFQLYSIEGPLLVEGGYLELVRQWQDTIDTDNVPLHIFYYRCRELMCTDWSKKDPNGDSFGGYWKYPEDLFEWNHASRLTMEKNVRELYKLPWPTQILLETIEMGCDNRLESVRYSNFICEWICRKYRQLNPDSPPLLGRCPILPDLDDICNINIVDDN